MSSTEQALMVYSLIKKFRLFMVQSGYSAKYIKNTYAYMRNFASFLEGIGIDDMRKVTRAVLGDYHREIYWTLSRLGKPYSANTLCSIIGALRAFFRYLVAEEVVLINPAIHLKLPLLDKIPKNILSQAEIEGLLSQPDCTSFSGVRDRAMLELFYGTGIRRRELVRLNLSDVDLKEEVLFIREGKGRKDRVVPMSTCAVRYLKKYLEERKKIAAGEPALFISRRSRKRIYYMGLSQWIRDYARRAGIEKKVTCHGLRHTCAVHFLEGGADIRAVQELLGHSSIENTQIYLTLSNDYLKKVHKNCHPRGNLSALNE